MDAAAALHWGLGRLRLEREVAAAPQLRYLDELARWNQAYNLTAVRNPVDMVFRHILDSLAVLPHVRGRVLDVGSGAGLPGVPLALAAPELHVVLLDSNGKKARFLRHVQRTLRLANIEVVQKRLEEFETTEPFDTVICRAFSALGEFAGAAVRLLAPAGRLIAMKGRLDEVEVKGMPPTVQIVERRALTIPGLHEARHLIVAQAAA